MAKPLKIADILEQQIEDETLRGRVNAEFQRHAASFRKTFTDVRDAVRKILSRALYEIAWYQEVPFVADDLGPAPAGRTELFDEMEGRLRAAIDRLETNAVEELRVQVARAVREKLIDKLRVAIPKYIASPGLLAIQPKLTIQADPPASGDPVRGQLRNVAEEGYRPAPLDRRTRESMGREKPENE